MRDFIKFRQKLYVTIALLAVTSCASWQVGVKKVGDATYEALRAATRTADAMVVAGTMSPAKRQEFAKEVTVPALTALDAAITATLQWQEGDPVPVKVSELFDILTKSADGIATSYGKDSELYAKLQSAKEAAREFLNKVS